MEGPKTCSSCRIIPKIKEMLYEEAHNFLVRGEILPGSKYCLGHIFFHGRLTDSDGSLICSKGVVGRKACRREPLHCYSYRCLLWFKKSWSPEVLMAGGLTSYYSVSSIPVLSHSHLLLAPFWQSAGWDGALAQLWQVWSHFLGCCLLTASRKKRLIKGSLLLAHLWGSLLHINVSTRMQSNANTSEGCYYLKLGRAAEEWLSIPWFLSHGIRK